MFPSRPLRIFLRTRLARLAVAFLLLRRQNRVYCKETTKQYSPTHTSLIQLSDKEARIFKKFKEKGKLGLVDSITEPPSSLGYDAAVGSERSTYRKLWKKPNPCRGETTDPSTFHMTLSESRVKSKL